MTYNPQHFKKTFESDLGQKIWNFLNLDITKSRMEISTELGHTAAEIVGKNLFQLFGTEVKKDRIKQATGHMIRHIMEELGYKLVKRNVKCKLSDVFTFASRYEK
jgi:hypothetical protein